MIKEIDCLTVTLEDVKEVAANYRLPLFNKEDRVSGFAGWFDVQFKVSGMCLWLLLVHCASMVCYSSSFDYNENLGSKARCGIHLCFITCLSSFSIPGALP
jgi:hypothetical protein